MRAVHEQVVELEVVEPALVPGGELVAETFADPAHRRLAHRRVTPERLGEHGFDVAIRQTAHPACDYQALERVRARHSRAEQLRGERHQRASATSGDAPP